ncbi:MAG: DUF5309 domain-containing protein [Oscillospiraceae bacterium]|jgi:hypothetical protein|nr:DUF5309 domain-containing protein [Oscillospiraceae bacterium]
MAGITGRGLTFNLPNFVGPLFEVTPTDTPFLSAIGGLSGGKETTSTNFQWQGYDLRDAGQNTKVEGAEAPEAKARVRFPVDNLVQIHQEAIDISYTKQAATGQYEGLNIAGSNPVMDEIGFQTQAALKEVARDIEYSFIRGTYHKPTDNTTARKTRGILEATTTNVITNSTPTELTDTIVLDLMQGIWDNGGIKESEYATLMVNSAQKRRLTKLFITDKGYSEETRNVAGVNVQTIETDFGRVNIMLNRYMPADQLAVVSLEMCAPVFLLIPGKGFLFVESLAKTGASDKFQIYGEIGLEYGNEKAHGKITGLTV